MSKSITPEEFQQIVGERAFNALLERFPGYLFYVPKVCINRLDRNARMRQEFYEGASIDSLVSKYELSKSTIYRILEN